MMEASELKQPDWLEADALAYEICSCADEAQHREDIARLLAYREAVLAEGMERAAVIAKSAKLPDGYQWGEDAMEQFNVGIACAADAIRAAKGVGHGR